MFRLGVLLIFLLDGRVALARHLCKDSLYSESENVVPLDIYTHDSFKTSSKSTIIIYYKYCKGGNKTLAADFKKIASELQYWKDQGVLEIGAFNCASIHFSDDCDDIIAYPTIRYFGEEQIGEDLINPNYKELRHQLYLRLIYDKYPWYNGPNFEPISDTETPDTIFHDGRNSRPYIALVYQPPQSYIGIETVLGLWDTEVRGRIVTDEYVAKRFNIGKNPEIIALLERKTGKLITIEADHVSSEYYLKAIKKKFEFIL